MAKGGSIDLRHDSAQPELPIPNWSQEEERALDRTLTLDLADLQSLPTSSERLAAGARLLVLALALWAGTAVHWLASRPRISRSVADSRGLCPAHDRTTQLATTRDLASGAWRNALLGCLPHHSAHHAFRPLPVARLPEVMPAST